MTNEELAKEIDEKSEDLEVFVKARDILYQRIMYVSDHSVSQLMPLHEWAGTHAVMNMMDVVIHNMERMLDELKTSIPSPEVKEEHKGSHLRLVKNGEEN